MSETYELNWLRQLAECLQSAWVNGNWKAETPNEREMEKLMTLLGYWPAKLDPNTLELVKPKYNEMKMYSHVLLNRLLDENEYNSLPDSEKQQYEFYGIVTHNNDGGDEMRVDMSRGIYNPDNTDNMTIDKTTTTITGQNNTGTYPEPGQTWLHYKGGRYEIIAMCNHTTTNEPLVIYKSKSFNGFHARPYNEWHDEIWENNYCKTRFTLIGW